LDYKGEIMDKTSTGVSKLKEWKGSSVWYKVNCACGSGECDSTIDLSFDKDFGDINVEFYKTIMWGDYYQKVHWWSRLWLRVKMVAQILFKGYTEHEGSFIIEGVDHLNSFIVALEEGREKVLTFEMENKD
jgi:hypothetical protein